KGVITFAAGQAFPGTGPGTVKSVGLSAPASDFTVTNSPILSTGTLTFNWIIPPSVSSKSNSIVKRGGDGDVYANYLSVTDLSGTVPAINGFGAYAGVYGESAGTNGTAI